MLYEILVTRITSAILLYHFTFLALSISMLGLGAPGVWYSVFAPTKNALGRSLLVAGATIPLSVAAIFKLGIYLTKGEAVTLGGLPLLVMGAALVPMLALGSAVCVLLMEAVGARVSRMYAADLIGASIGALCVIPLMRLFDTPYILACAGLMPLASAALVAPETRTKAAVIGMLVIASIAWGEPYRLRYNRVYVETDEPLFERWTATGRITVRPKDKKLEAYILGASVLGPGSKYKDVGRDHLWILQEGGAGTTITRMPDSPSHLDYLAYDVTGVGYQIWPSKQVCVIGAGGGRDVLTALHFGARKVDAVELHSEILDAMRGPFGAYSGHLYDLPKVRPISSEGRSFLEHSQKKYDFIQISLVDSWAATAAGAFALSENYLYTTEAVQLYLSRLSDGGVISITRFYADGMVAEAIRLSYMVLHALELQGAREPLKHIIAINAWNKFTLLVSRAPISEAQIERAEQVSAERGFLTLFPRDKTTPRYSTFTKAVAIEPRPTAGLGRDLTPPTDDRPYFFQSASFLSGIGELGPNSEFNAQAVLLLRFLLEVLVLLSFAFFFLPFVLRGRLERGPNFGRGTLYFASIGLAFMFVETSFIQRFILYLGHPSYALTVVLASLLSWAGIGSWLVSKTPTEKLQRYVLSAPLCVLTVSLVAGWLLPSTLGWSFAPRIAISVALLAPLGLSLGLCFPSGMILFSDRNRAWFWAVNGAMSVLGSVLTMVFSMIAGFAIVTALGAGLYVVAYLLLGTAPAPRSVISRV